MSDLVAETEDAMRQERLEKIWHDHKTKIITAISALILGTAAVSAHDYWDRSQNIKSTNSMLALLEDEAFPENITPETELNMRSGVKALLLLKAAGTYAENDQTQQAIALYDKTANDTSIEQSLRDLATLSKVRLQTNAENPDIETLKSTLEPIAQNDKSAYKHLAIIESAALSSRLDDYETAITLLEEIKNTPNLTDTLYLKAQSLSHLYKLKQAEKTNEG